MFNTLEKNEKEARLEIEMANIDLGLVLIRMI